MLKEGASPNRPTVAADRPGQQELKYLPYRWRAVGRKVRRCWTTVEPDAELILRGWSDVVSSARMLPLWAVKVGTGPRYIRVP